MSVPGYWRIEKKLLNRRLSKFQSSINFNPEANFYIFADPRGGSTWLTEIIKELTNSAIIWEPLAISKVKEIKELGFAWRQFIPEDVDWAEAKAELDKIFRGRTLNDWLTTRTDISELKQASNLLVKFCRGNQLLPWMTNRFDFKYKPVFMVRHPFAVVASQMKQGGWDYSFDSFDIPNGPYNHVYLEHEEFLSQIKTKEQALVATWCMCNQVPLNHKNNNKNWITLNYEEFLLRPKDSILRVFKEWNLNSANIDDLNFSKPSKTTVKGSPISGRAQIENWMKSFSKIQIVEMERVLDYFGVEAYSSNPFPEIIYNYGNQ